MIKIFVNKILTSMYNIIRGLLILTLPITSYIVCLYLMVSLLAITGTTLFWIGLLAWLLPIIPAIAITNTVWSYLKWKHIPECIRQYCNITEVAFNKHYMEGGNK